MSIEVDDPTTWPPAVAKYVSQVADRVRGTTEFACDLKLYDHEEPFLKLFEGQLVRAYHCTRLLEHERDNIRANGLRPLSADLMTDRIEDAHRAGAITDDQRSLFLNNHAFSRHDPDRGSRADRVCLVIGRSSLDEHAHGLSGYLDTWGGEALVSYLGWWNSPERAQLQALGRPAIVLGQLDVGAPGSHLAFPSLINSFVGHALKLRQVGAEVHYMAAIPGDRIDIWEPGDDEYDHHAQFPRG